jgi:hypothetical protein
VVVRSFLAKAALGFGLMAAPALVAPEVAVAAPKAKAVSAKRAPKAKAKKPKADAAHAAPASEAAEPRPETPPAAAPAGEGSVQAAGTQAPAQKTPKGAVKEQEGPEGVKTYEFSAIEVEGRLRSPQILYFLRRVRAEFDAGGLGHRSFLGELKDTRNNAAFR